MIRKTVLSLYMLIILSITACDLNDKKSVIKDETPKALKDDSAELKSYSSREDIVDGIFDDLVSKSETLKRLEKELEVLSKSHDEALVNYNNYISKSEDYYTSAIEKVKSVQDVVLKEKMQVLLKNSQSNFAVKTSKLSALEKAITSNNVKINDKYISLKIALTLPVIEKYQQNNLPDRKEFGQLIKEQNRLLKQMDSIIKK